jgi:hypothetical protein
MPDGSMKLGGEAVAEVLRRLPNAKWFAGCFTVSIFGFQPFQMILNMSYAILADVRPIFGCESCGTPSWLRPIGWLTKWAKGIFGEKRDPISTPHFTSLAARGVRPPPVSGGKHLASASHLKLRGTSVNPTPPRAVESRKPWKYRYR